ncbi:uncharacterized protein LOC131156023 [Malania oleifera]|uniref:uncharacterized protein LOC131156023 n=1 Tax=Malania oleifera TaxID=397392 RepID=UPI0025AE987C|nr:uncharacterized protein LOC131156023 [Malania oleifera]
MTCSSAKDVWKKLDRRYGGTKKKETTIPDVSSSNIQDVSSSGLIVFVDKEPLSFSPNHHGKPHPSLSIIILPSPTPAAPHRRSVAQLSHTTAVPQPPPATRQQTRAPAPTAAASPTKLHGADFNSTLLATPERHQPHDPIFTFIDPTTASPSSSSNHQPPTTPSPPSRNSGHPLQPLLPSPGN